MRDVFIVEDGAEERRRLETLFSGAGYSVATAQSVEEAESVLKLESFRLAILDIGLGDKSGSYLFEKLNRGGQIPFIIVLTGNSSVHLKQRFLEEGAVAYITKASSAAENDALLGRVASLLGAPETQIVRGIALDEFLRSYLNETSRELFLDQQNQVAPCVHCGSIDFHVVFNQKTQLPPIVEGHVMCLGCGKEMNPKVE